MGAVVCIIPRATGRVDVHQSLDGGVLFLVVEVGRRHLEAKARPSLGCTSWLSLREGGFRVTETCQIFSLAVFLIVCKKGIQRCCFDVDVRVEVGVYFAVLGKFVRVTDLAPQGPNSLSDFTSRSRSLTTRLQQTQNEVEEVLSGRGVL